MKKSGYVVSRSKIAKKYFTASSSYNRAEWVELTEATVYHTPEAANDAAKRLWQGGEFSAKVIPLAELAGLQLEMPPKDEDELEDPAMAGAPVDPLDPDVPVDPDAEDVPSDDDMVAQDQEPVDDTEMKGVCPECDAEPCECGSMDGIPDDNPPGEDQAVQGLENEEGVCPGCKLPMNECLCPNKDKAAGLDVAAGLPQPRMEAAMPNVKKAESVAKPTENKDTAATLKNKVEKLDVKDASTPDTEESDILGKCEDALAIPAEVKSALKAAISEFEKAAKHNEGADDSKASFAMTVADALNTLHKHLQVGTIEGMKQAQIHYQSLMSPIRNHIPEDVRKFVERGGKRKSLKDMFDVKWEKVRGTK